MGAAGDLSAVLQHRWAGTPITLYTPSPAQTCLQLEAAAEGQDMAVLHPGVIKGYS